MQWPNFIHWYVIRTDSLGLVSHSQTSTSSSSASIKDSPGTKGLFLLWKSAGSSDRWNVTIPYKGDVNQLTPMSVAKPVR